MQRSCVFREVIKTQKIESFDAVVVKKNIRNTEVTVFQKLVAKLLILVSLEKSEALWKNYKYRLRAKPEHWLTYEEKSHLDGFLSRVNSLISSKCLLHPNMTSFEPYQDSLSLHVEVSLSAALRTNSQFHKRTIR